MNNKFELRLETIANDKTSGSIELLQKLNKLIKDLLTAHQEENKYILKKIIAEAKKDLSEFQIIDSYLKNLKESIDDKNELLKIVNSFDSDSMDSFKRIYKNVKPFLRNKKRALTLSNSKTIVEVFSLWNDQRNLSVIVCESRPKNEGRLLAKALLKKNISVQLIVDALMDKFIKECDAVIIGADRILSNGSVINKIGSKTAAVLCKKYKKPFYVLAAKSKFSKNKNFVAKRRPSSEVWNFTDKNLEIKNIYFEEIESDLITKIISD